MEEDIDIEEHDVLDNPRIRDIFPDLSRVKTEIHSDEEDQQEDENCGIQIKQEYIENYHDNSNLGDGNDEPTFGNSDPNNGNNDPAYGNEDFLPGNIAPIGNDYPSDDNNDNLYRDKVEDGNYNPMDGNDSYQNERVYPTNVIRVGKPALSNSKSDLIDGNSGNDNYNSTIVIDDSDANDDDNLENDSDNIVNDENEGDDEAETSETDLQDAESLQNNKKRYTLLRKLLTEETNDYVIPNKIIVGSRKANNEKVDKEYQKAIVLLEDWGQKLTQSGSFCNQCEILFETPNALDHHKMSCHSFLVAVAHNKAIKSIAKSNLNVARKSTANIATKSDSKFCHHCNMVFPDDTSLIKHLYKLVPNKQFSCGLCKLKFSSQSELTAHNIKHRVIPTIVKGMDLKVPNKISNEPQIVNDEKFKCKICFEVLDSYYSCKRHRKEKHASFVKKAIFVKIKSKPKSLVELKNEQKIATVKKEIGDNDHLLPKSTLFQCKSCKLHFISGFNAVLHKVCNIILSYWICSICNRRFRNEDKLLHKKQHEHNSRFKVFLIVPDLYHKILCRCPDCNLHFEEKLFKSHFNNCSNIPTEECKNCKILIPKTRFMEHAKKHYYLNLKPKDFIIITFLSERNLKRKLSNDFPTPAKKIKMEHVSDAKTENDKRKITLFYCKTCQCCMKMPKPTHTLKMCKATTTRIVCILCGLGFTSKSLKMHMTMHRKIKFTLKDVQVLSLETKKVISPPIPKYSQCQKCKIKFFRPSLMRGHICGEDYDTCNVCGDMYHSTNFAAHVLFHGNHKKDLKKPELQKKRVKIMPELLKKYELLNAMWNILFHCNICNVLTDSYDKCVEHCQAHINKQNVSEQTIKCYICNMKFYESCWAKHTELHSRMKITYKDFKVLQFDPKKLLSEAWFQIFESLPEKETNQIMDSSVYGQERAVKMMLNKPGRSEFTLYICSNCSVCIEQTDIRHHVDGECINPKYICEICDICFAEEVSVIQHQDLHAKGINKEEFRVVSFEVKREDALKKYTLYKCSMCGACVSHRKSMWIHKCPKRKVTVYCELCDQSFVYQAAMKHENRHKIDPNFKVENIKIVHFHPKSEKEGATTGDYTVVSKLGQPMKTFKYKKIPNVEMTEEDDPTSDQKIDLYRCIKCKVCVLFKFRLLNHVCLPANKRFACKVCKQLFPTCTMPRHQARHRNNTNFQAKNFRIINFSSKNNKIKYHNSENDKLFKSANKTNTSFNDNSSNSKANVRKTGEFSTSKKYTFYKCTDCKSCLTKLRNTSHKCLNDKLKYYCDICDMIIFVANRMAHNKQHEEDPELNSDNITIIEFKNKEIKLESESRPNSDAEMVDESEYSVDKSQIEQQPLSDELITLHRCKDCKICLCTTQKSNVLKHQCVTDDKKAFCNICGEFFNIFRFKPHMKLHKERNLTFDNFTVVNFKSRNTLISKRLTFESDGVENESGTDNYESTRVKGDCDNKSESIHQESENIHQESESIQQESESIQQETESIEEDVENESEHVDSYDEIDIEEDDGVEDKMKLYKCNNCKVCIHYKKSIVQHTCRGRGNPYFCKKCKQYFCKSMRKTHMLKHKMKTLLASKIKIIKFTPLVIGKVKIKHNTVIKRNKSKRTCSWKRGEIPKRKTYKKDDKIPAKQVTNSATNIKNSAKIYKCDCGLHFTAEKLVKEHADLCNENLEISKENCSKCGLLFPTDILVSHLCKHHSTNMKIEVENYSQNLEPSATVETETPSDKTIEKVVEDTTDTKPIPQDTLDTSEPEKSDTNEVKKTADTKKKKADDTKKKIKPDLYKCQDCNVYFISQNTCYRHVLYHEKLDPKTYIECKICGLQFSLMTLVTHMRIHHSRPFDLEKKMVEIYYPVENDKPMRKELYCAGDKIQSLLVSSSNDS